MKIQIITHIMTHMNIIHSEDTYEFGINYRIMPMFKIVQPWLIVCCVDITRPKSGQKWNKKKTLQVSVNICLVLCNFFESKIIKSEGKCKSM